ncbi:MAG: GNAT family N-acetyltransferase, partial [Muribaculum sp.]|nr:GNAT family N-acetyltransferase [Muribaculum sp.]
MTELRRVYDIETLMKWRKEVIFNVFGMDANNALLDANREYYRRHIPDETHRAIVASIDGEDVGGGAVCISEELPSPDNPSGKCAYLMNIYVREPYRNHG